MVKRVILLVALCCVWSPGLAAFVPAGETISLFGTNVIDRPEIGGTIINQLFFDFEQVDGAGLVLFSGTVEVRLRGFVSREYWDGVFAQEYRIASFTDYGSGFQIDGLNTEPVFGFDPNTGEGAVDVDFRQDDVPGVNPATASYMTNSPGVNFEFATSVLDGQNSSWIFVHASGSDIATSAGMAGAHLLIGNGSDSGGRKGDAGTSVFASQGFDPVAGPDFFLNPDTTSGKFAFAWDNFWKTPFYYMTQDNALQVGPLAPNPGTITNADAVALGYAPTEGDTVPRRILRAGEGSRADITALGTTFTPLTPDNSYGVWNVQMQRAMNTGNPDDVAMVPGQVYEAGFEVHLWEYTTRDHYVSFPQTISVGPGAADIQAVSIPGTGPEQGPNWNEIPMVRLNLFQPGITTWEFLTGQNETNGVEYTNAQGQLVGQAHSGSGAVDSGSNRCTDCHTVLTSEPAPPLFNAGAMEDLTERRGGIWEDTPVVAIP